MTDEQIKQNAEEYAKKHYDIPFEDDSSMNVIVSEESYIAGAHSRDAEVFILEERAKYLHESMTLFKQIIDMDYNPWISVEEQLPEEDKDNSGYSVKVIGMFADGHISDCFCSLEEDIWFIDIFTCDKPTYWMKIPKCNYIEVEGGDK